MPRNVRYMYNIPRRPRACAFGCQTRLRAHSLHLYLSRHQNSSVAPSAAQLALVIAALRPGKICGFCVRMNLRMLCSRHCVPSFTLALPSCTPSMRPSLNGLHAFTKTKKEGNTHFGDGERSVLWAGVGVGGTRHGSTPRAARRAGDGHGRDRARPRRRGARRHPSGTRTRWINCTLHLGRRPNHRGARGGGPTYRNPGEVLICRVTKNVVMHRWGTPVSEEGTEGGQRVRLA